MTWIPYFIVFKAKYFLTGTIFLCQGKFGVVCLEEYSHSPQGDFVRCSMEDR